MTSPRRALAAAPERQAGATAASTSAGVARAWLVAAASAPGPRRGGNEDSVHVDDHLAAVADGMGGHAGGRDASQLAISTVVAAMGLGPARQAASAVADAIRDAHREIVAIGHRTQRPAMGTTFTAVTWDHPTVTCVVTHVGDSRAYLLRGERLTGLTVDHTTEWVADDGRRRRGLVRCVGGRGNRCEPDVVAVSVQGGDRLLLCTDGVCGPLNDDALLAILALGAPPATTAQQLVATAHQLGGGDDATAVVIDLVRADHQTTQEGN